VGQAYSSAPEGSTTAKPGALHAAAGPCGLAESGARCAEMLAEALGGGGGRIEKFSQRRLGSALAGWPGNAVLHAFHEAHHRGQVLCSRISSDFPLPKEVAYGIWELGKAVERVRVACGPGLRFLRNRSRVRTARGMGCDGGDIKHRGAKNYEKGHAVTCSMLLTLLAPAVWARAHRRTHDGRRGLRSGQHLDQQQSFLRSYSVGGHTCFGARAPAGGVLRRLRIA